MMMTSHRPVGHTASVRFQIGVRRSLPLSQEQAWRLLTSPQGRKLWLGDLEEVNFTVGHTYKTSEGTTGEICVVKPMEQLRLTWQPKEWPKPPTLQIRLLPSNTGKTTISFHQEKLEDEQRREEMKLRWEEVLAGLGGMMQSEFEHD
jgi:uncharacterized protein YndB with AHSA1/START domain